MITIFRSNGLWTVGAAHDRNNWVPLRDCSSAEEAMAWLSYLNGGEYPQQQPSFHRSERYDAV